MIIDIHSHMINPDFCLDKMNFNYTTRMFFLRLKISNYQQYYEKFSRSLSESSIDKAVLVALENTILCSNNQQTVEICKQNKNFLYGANLNPLDADIEDKFNTALNNNAVLVKILPSFQDVDLSDKKCIPFFEMLKENNLPLLVHTGLEHTLKNSKQYLNDPKKLENAAKLGVKIICAHCGTKLHFYENCYFEDWKNLARKYENVYGDLSGMILFFRKSYLKKILKDHSLKSKVVFGSDFPAYPFINMRKDRDNIFQDWYETFEEIGFNEEFFTRGDKLIKFLPNQLFVHPK